MKYLSTAQQQAFSSFYLLSKKYYLRAKIPWYDRILEIFCAFEATRKNGRRKKRREWEAINRINR